jgi:hypothetical protein
MQQHAVLRPCPACRKDWTLLRDDSIFVDWQHLKVQENVEEVRGLWQAATVAYRNRSSPVQGLRTVQQLAAACPVIWSAMQADQQGAIAAAAVATVAVLHHSRRAGWQLPKRTCTCSIQRWHHSVQAHAGSNAHISVNSTMLHLRAND